MLINLSRKAAESGQIDTSDSSARALASSLSMSLRVFSAQALSLGRAQRQASSTSSHVANIPRHTTSPWKGCSRPQLRMNEMTARLRYPAGIEKRTRDRTSRRVLPVAVAADIAIRDLSPGEPSKSTAGRPRRSVDVAVALLIHRRGSRFQLLVKISSPSEKLTAARLSGHSAESERPCSEEKKPRDRERAPFSRIWK